MSMSEVQAMDDSKTDVRDGEREAIIEKEDLLLMVGNPQSRIKWQAWS